MRMAFNEGRRDFGNELFREVMNVCPEMFQVMQREARDNKEQQDGTKRDGNGNPKSK